MVRSSCPTVSSRPKSVPPSPSTPIAVYQASHWAGVHTSYAGGAGADAAGIWTRWSDSRVGLTWTSGVGLRRTSCDSNLSLRQHGPVSPAEVQAVCSRLNLPVLRDLQALVKGFHPNTAADSSRQSFKTLLVSRCYFRLKLNACSLTAR